jgi:DNA primase
MVLENLIDCDIYAFQNEGVIPDLNFLSVYDRIYVLYDNDLAGYKAAKTLVQAIKNFGFTAKAIFIPEELNSKDIDELYINEGEWITSEILHELIHQNTLIYDLS